MSGNRIAPTATVNESVDIATDVQVWDYSQIRENAVIGTNVIIGRNVYIGPGVEIGSNSKIQNNALIYEPAMIQDGVFIGPGAILTNDRNPRSVNPDGTRKSPSDWESSGVRILEGASIGAGAVCISPVKIGFWSIVAAGSVVTKDVANYALVAGNPARQIGWVGKAGFKLIKKENGEFQCPKTSVAYHLKGGELFENQR